MEIQLKELFNKHKNIPCIILGASQNMMNFDYKNFKGIIISVGSSILRIENKFDVDYLVSANNEFPIPEISFHLKFLNQLSKKTIWVMSDTACYNTLFTENKNLWKNHLKIKYTRFDDRHFSKKKCISISKCCEYLKLFPNRQTIYEILFLLYKKKNKIKKIGTTTAEPALALSLILGCNPIFIQGVDIPTKYYHGKQINKKYYGYESLFADKFEDRTMRLLRWKYFFFYIKKLSFKPYLLKFLQRLKIGKKNSFFSLNNFSNSMKNFFQLGKLAKEQKIKIFVLSKESTLLRLKNFIFLNPEICKKKFSSFFKKKT